MQVEIILDSLVRLHVTPSSIPATAKRKLKIFFPNFFIQPYKSHEGKLYLKERLAKAEEDSSLTKEKESFWTEYCLELVKGLLRKNQSDTSNILKQEL